MLVRTLGDRVDAALDLKPGLPACKLDPTHLEMALLNVLINARDAMPDGGQVTRQHRRAHGSGRRRPYDVRSCVPTKAKA
jgi:nitrogen-specific signal transduction histidine kinase